MEGLTLAVEDVKRSVAFYGKKLGLKIEIDSAPHFAFVPHRAGCLDRPPRHPPRRAERHQARDKAQHAAIHVELSTDDLDGLYKRLKARGVAFSEPPHDEAWERSAQARDPDGYTIEFAQGRRGRNAPRT